VGFGLILFENFRIPDCQIVGGVLQLALIINKLILYNCFKKLYILPILLYILSINGHIGLKKNIYKLKKKLINKKAFEKKTVC